MSTLERSASAADKLQALTAQYSIAAALHFDYLKVIRALNTLLEHMNEVAGDKAAVQEWIRANVEFAELKRQELGKYCERKQARMNELNQQIQNGVYDNE